MTQEQNALLREILLDIELEELEAYSKDAPVTFSPRFEKRMSKLIRAQRRPGWHLTNTFGKRVAIVAVAVLLLLLATISISASRDSVSKLAMEFGEDYVDVFVREWIPDAPQYIETVHVFSEVPEGYVQAEQGKMRRVAKTYWRKGDEWIQLRQSVINGGISSMDYNGIHEIYTVGDWEVLYVKTKGGDEYIWITDDYKYSLSLSEELDQATVLKMIESLK